MRKKLHDRISKAETMKMTLNFFYHRVNEKRNGLGIILREQSIKVVLEVNKMSVAFQ